VVNAARASAPHAATPPSSNRSLAKLNRKPMQLTENKHQRSKSIASFCRYSLTPPPDPADHDSRGTYHSSRLANHQSLSTSHAFLIATRPLLEIELTHSQQTRKYFLIANFSAISAPAPHRNASRRRSRFCYPHAGDVRNVGLKRKHTGSQRRKHGEVAQGILG
jgi:hypothetical protein